MLCTARSYPAEHAGRYELPGGKVEPGETPAEALARELREEIDLEVRLGEEVRPSPALAVGTPEQADVADPSTHPGDDAASWRAMHGYRMRVWLAEPADPEHGPHRGTAHSSMSWVPLDEVADLPWLPADLPILTAIHEVVAL
ncbi:(deoxy)nucleoside triphosphate pyrophosphohydrolase [Actinomyces radicidentis]|uniref:(deoxy)nucleoside triphosphate pyrophosphohydrolase n=1 Tax=Actinomyces radicidentis TaxID=111015 RepID=UPI0036F20860